jgi:hypothetical protein
LGKVPDARPVTLEVNASEEGIQATVMASKILKKFLECREMSKVFVANRRLVNIVIYIDPASCTKLIETHIFLV